MGIFRKKKKLNPSWNVLYDDARKSKKLVAITHSSLSDTEIETKIVNALKEAISSQLMLKDDEKERLNLLASQIASKSFDERIRENLFFAQAKYDGIGMSEAFPKNVLHELTRNLI